MPHLPESLFDPLSNSIEQNEFVRLTLSKPRIKSDPLQKVIVRLTEIRQSLQLSFTFRYQTRDITKNSSIDEGLQTISDLFKESFFIANLTTTKVQLVVSQSKKGKLLVNQKAIPSAAPPSRQHDHQKKQPVEDQRFLVLLGILTAKGQIKKDKGDKYRQIRKFVEILDGLVKQSPVLSTKENLNIVDMGAGKGYLTFALYNYFQQQSTSVKVTGVEIRPELIEAGNQTAAALEYQDLKFEAGFISDYQLPDTDILMALHACDTATDDAIFKGIQAKAELIICSPCCHKQIRRAMTKSEQLQPILGFGILKERQAEIVTDTIRALLLESQGYKTKVFEFISTEHTGKNVMIVGQKHQRPVDKNIFFEQIRNLKNTFGIDQHYLETLLASAPEA